MKIRHIMMGLVLSIMACQHMGFGGGEAMPTVTRTGEVKDVIIDTCVPGDVDRQSWGRNSLDQQAAGQGAGGLSRTGRGAVVLSAGVRRLAGREQKPIYRQPWRQRLSEYLFQVSHGNQICRTGGFQPPQRGGEYLRLDQHRWRAYVYDERSAEGADRLKLDQEEVQ